MKHQTLFEFLLQSSQKGGSWVFLNSFVGKVGNESYRHFEFVRLFVVEPQACRGNTLYLRAEEAVPLNEEVVRIAEEAYSSASPTTKGVQRGKTNSRKEQTQVPSSETERKQLKHFISTH